jgi:hypothetical protein
MKLRLFTALAAAMIMIPGVAHAMDCCKDGKCECCKKDEAAPPTTPQDDHKH